MLWVSRVLVCCVLVGCAGDNRLDPSELELRDLLGISPEAAMGWDAGQRAAARHMMDAAMHETPAPVHAALGPDHEVTTALAASDEDRANHRLPALGVVQLAIEHDDIQATSRASTLVKARTGASPNRPGGAASSVIEVRLAGWTERPGYATLPSRGLDVLTTIASDAGHRSGPVIVMPAAQLPVIAGYIAATATEPARLVVNPVLLAALEPPDPLANRMPSLTASRVVAPTSPTSPAVVTATAAVGNPYSFYSSVAACANAQQTRCEACLPTGTCTSFSGTANGTAECQQLAAGQGRGYSLLCINFAVAIDSIQTCAASTAPSCPLDAHAGESLSYLDHNADFLDRPDCAGSLDLCLKNQYGPTPASTPTRSPGTSCADSSCEASGCDNGGACASGADSSSCDSGDSSDSSCDGGSSNSGCESSSSGGGCDSSGDSGCNSGGGDCSGDSGGDCSGGGGNDCNAGGSRHDHGYLWALLPVPFAIIARRRADRRRAMREVAP